MRLTKRGPNCVVTGKISWLSFPKQVQCSNSLPVLFKWIEVVSEGARKEHWVLCGGRNNQLTSHRFFRTISHPWFSSLVSGETCGMMVSLLLSLCRPNSEMSTPSINIRPEAGSINLRKQSCQQIKTLDRTHLKRARVRELLPAPVRPTMPTLSPP